MAKLKSLRARQIMEPAGPLETFGPNPEQERSSPQRVCEACSGIRTEGLKYQVSRATLLFRQSRGLGHAQFAHIFFLLNKIFLKARIDGILDTKGVRPRNGLLSIVRTVLWSLMERDTT